MASGAAGSDRAARTSRPARIPMARVRLLAAMGIVETGSSLANFAIGVTGRAAGSCVLVNDSGAMELASGAAGSDPSGGRGSPSRLRPSTNWRPSQRIFLVIAQNCSRCHLMVTFDPTSIGRSTRTHAPERDVSSSIPRVTHKVPASFCQNTSARAHTGVRGSIIPSSMP